MTAGAVDLGCLSLSPRPRIRSAKMMNITVATKTRRETAFFVGVCGMNSSDSSSILVRNAVMPTRAGISSKDAINREGKTSYT